MVNQTGGSAILDAYAILKKLQIKERMKIADFGCGAYGHFIFPAAKMIGPKGEVYAVDILKPALESVAKRAKQDNLTQVKTIWSDIEIFGATKIETESLDVGMIINNLFIAKKRAELIRECLRLVKKGGKLLIIEWENVASPFGPPAEARVKADSLKKAAEKLGLKLLESFSAGQFHYGLIFEKL